MPAFVPTNYAVKARLHFLWQNQKTENGLWFMNNAVANWTGAERLQLADDLKTWWDTQMKTNIPADVALSAIEVINQESNSAPSSMRVYTPPSPGLSAGSSALNVTLALSARSDQRGRSYRGRFYVNGIIAGNMVNPGTLSTAGVSALVSALAWLMTPGNIHSKIWAVVSHFANHVARAGGFPSTITAVTADTLLDSQRRRLIGRGQ
jgi:hypothetical protein